MKMKRQPYVTSLGRHLTSRETWNKFARTLPDGALSFLRLAVPLSLSHPLCLSPSRVFSSVSERACSARRPVPSRSELASGYLSSSDRSTACLDRKITIDAINNATNYRTSSRLARRVPRLVARRSARDVELAQTNSLASSRTFVKSDYVVRVTLSLFATSVTLKKECR